MKRFKFDIIMLYYTHKYKELRDGTGSDKEVSQCII